MRFYQACILFLTLRETKNTFCLLQNKDKKVYRICEKKTPLENNKANLRIGTGEVAR